MDVFLGVRLRSDIFHSLGVHTEGKKRKICKRFMLPSGGSELGSLGICQDLMTDPLVGLYRQHRTQIKDSRGCLGASALPIYHFSLIMGVVTVAAAPGNRQLATGLAPLHAPCTMHHQDPVRGACFIVAMVFHHGCSLIRPNALQILRI